MFPLITGWEDLVLSASNHLNECRGVFKNLCGLILKDFHFTCFKGSWIHHWNEHHDHFIAISIVVLWDHETITGTCSDGKWTQLIKAAVIRGNERL